MQRVLYRKNIFILAGLVFALLIIGLRILPNWNNVTHHWLLLGRLAYELAVAYVIASIFYTLTIYISEKETKAALSPYIKSKVESIKGRPLGMVLEMSNVAKQPINGDFPTKKVLKEIFLKVGPNDKSRAADISMKQLTLLQYLEAEIQVIERNISQLLRIAPYLDTELIDIILKVEDSSFLNVIHVSNLSGVNNKNFSNYLDIFEDFIEKIKRLENYYTQRLSS